MIVKNKQYLLGVELYQPEQLAQMSAQALQAYVGQLNTEIQYMQNQLVSGELDPGGVEGTQQAIMSFQAEVAAVMDLIHGTITPSQVEHQYQTYLSTYQNAVNHVTPGNVTAQFGSFAPIVDFFSGYVGPLTVAEWSGIGLVAYFLLK